MNIASRNYVKTLALVLLAVFGFQVSVRAQDKAGQITEYRAPMQGSGDEANVRLVEGPGPRPSLSRS